MTQKDRCCVCGKKRLNPTMLTCNNCCPFLYKEGHHPHQLLRRSNEWKEKKLRKLGEVGNKCEQCGRVDQPLSIYHIEEINYQTYKNLWDGAVKWRLLNFLSEKRERMRYADIYLDRETKKHYKKQLKFFEMRRETEERGTFRYYESDKLKTLQSINTIKNLMKNNNLYNKLGLDKPELRVISGVYSEVHLNKLISKLIKIIFWDILEEYDERVKELLKKYLDLSSTMVFCKKCHNDRRRESFEE
jgi:hypothetical protein